MEEVLGFVKVGEILIKLSERREIISSSSFSGDSMCLTLVQLFV